MFDFKREVHRIVAESLRIPAEDRLAYLKGELSKFPPEYRDAAEILVLHTEVLVTNTNTSGARLWEKIAIFAFGVIFLVLLLGIAIFIPSPTEFQIFVFRLTLAMSLAAVAALVPGFLNIDVKYKNNFLIRAGGAIAVFVLVYMINPPALLHK